MIIDKFILSYINEHYSDCPVYALNNIFKLGLTKAEVESSKVVFEDDKATILLNGKTFEIEFEDDYYIIRKFFKDYTFISYHEFDQSCYMKSFTFDVDDDKKIVLEGIDVDNTMKSLTIKNIIGDNVVMERENSHALLKKSICTSRYKNSNNNECLEKFIFNEEGKKLYYLLSSNFNNNFSVSNYYGRYDIALSYNGKKEMFSGKISEYDDLLKETESFDNPNAIIRLLVFDGKIINYYKVYVVKKNNKLHFYFRSKELLVLDSNGISITDEDIKLIKDNIANIIDYEAVYVVKNGFDIVLTSEKIEDYIDFQLCTSNKIDSLAFDIYDKRDIYFKGNSRQVNL